jgi:hypothetical protein
MMTFKPQGNFNKSSATHKTLARKPIEQPNTTQETSSAKDFMHIYLPSQPIAGCKLPMSLVIDNLPQPVPKEGNG